MSILQRIHNWWMNEFADAAKTALDDISHVDSTKPASDDFLWVEETTDPLQPLYFVRRPDNTFLIAKPQPSLYAKVNPIHRVIAKQVSFLLSQAPMLDAPDNLERAAHAVTKFAYIHPKTFAKFTRGAYSPLTSAPYVRIKPSPTKWVLTTMMPEDRVIYTPNPIPGLEKILAS